VLEDRIVGKSPAQMTAAFKILSRRLLAARSATRTLEAWCAEHDIGDGTVTARVLSVENIHPPADVPRLLCAEPQETLGYRRVALISGEVTLSVAENWYLPTRLHPSMLRTLNATTIPFGVAVEALRPSRRTFHVAVTADSLVHHAVVESDDGWPIAVVHERYQPVLCATPRTADDLEQSTR
jgi:chorismate-pyruvate lyase